MSQTIGVLPLGRPTFDVAFAEQTLAKALAALDATDHRIVGPRALLFDAEATGAALEALSAQGPDLLLILQVTFTDASMTVAAATTLDAHLAIWAFPEPRLGGRLRLNSFCGLNLAAHALGLGDHLFSYLYAAPDGARIAEELDALVAGRRQADKLAANPPNPEPGRAAAAKAEAVLGALAGATIGRFGAHPEGFHTCAYDATKLKALAKVEVAELGLEDLFARARAVPASAVAETHALAARDLSGLDEVDQGQLDRSLRLKSALDEFRAEGNYAAFAIRCWPETFTEYGGAVCGPVSMMGEQRIPCACEADVFGALTCLILQELATAPAFQVDLVDLDPADETAVVWHCGQAPISMADTEAEPVATIHTNRKMPLLYEFPLKPGRVTFARVSQARGEIKLVIAGGEMLRRPKSFTGTSGVVAFDAPARTVKARIMGAAVEHHAALVYGDYRAELHAVAQALRIPVVEIA